MRWSDMGQRQDKDEIIYGRDCGAGFAAGKTPKYVYGRFSNIIRCPLAVKPPPNDRVFKLTQHDTASCRWVYYGTGWFCGLQSFTPFADYSIDLATSPEGMGYFNAVHAMPFEEGLVFANTIQDCVGVHMGHHGICIVTWRLESIKLLDDLNIDTESDLFMEMRPLADGSRVYKYCRLQDATNIAIKYEPD